MINENDILDIYRLEGNLREYNYGQQYLKFKNNNFIKFNPDEFPVHSCTLSNWKTGKSTPNSIQNINFLKEKKILPFDPCNISARIVGVLHGDGNLYSNLRSFGFTSSDKKMLEEIRTDVKTVFKIDTKITKKREKGETVIIMGKTRKSTKPTYDLKFNNHALCLLLYKLGVPKGKKVEQKYLVPEWIINGSNEIKIGFLQGLFDSELSNFKVHNHLNHKDNINELRLELCKNEKYKDCLISYLNQIVILLFNLGIKSRIDYPSNYREGYISFKVVISNQLDNLYKLIQLPGFYYTTYKLRKSSEVNNLILEKMENKSIIPDVLKYIIDKNKFRTEDLVKNLKISKSYSTIVCKFLFKNGFANRVRRKDYYFDYFPNIPKIEEFLNDPIKLYRIPPIKSALNKKIL